MALDDHKSLTELYHRYNTEQQQVIEQYWKTIKYTRRSGRISESVITKEMEIWQEYDPAIVIRALTVHINKHKTTRETYTRGIMRNMADQSRYDPEPDTSDQLGGISQPGTNPPPVSLRKTQPAAQEKRNRFNNFSHREIDYEAIEHLELLLNMGQLTEDKRKELSQNPRYMPYIGTIA